MTEQTPFTSLQYPIGKFVRSAETLTHNERQDYIQAIRDTPALLKKAVESLSEAQLDTPYRPDGWKTRQLIHHIADSHMNGYIRFKLALTEDTPLINAYDEKKWAQTQEIFTVPVKTSIILLEMLHERWVSILESLKPEDFKLSFRHPVSGIMTLDQALALYAWHSKHHLTQIIRLIERNNW